MSTTISLITACSTCAKNFAHGRGDAAGWAILFMLCVVLPILVSILFFVIRIAKRQQKFADPQYSDN